MLALSLWLGFVLASGTFAALVFQITKGLDPRLPGYEGYTGEHYLIVGGHMAQTVFFVTDVVQFACALVSCITLGGVFVMLRGQARRPAMVARFLALALALGSVASLLLIVNPKLTIAMRLYWEAAKAGDNASAITYRAVAAETHPYATGLMLSAAVSVLVALVAAVWSLAKPFEESVWVPGSRLPEPALLRGRRA